MDAISQTDIIKCIFLNENVRILIKISLKIVPKGPNNNIPALFQNGAKPLSETMLVSFNELTLIWHMWGRSCPMKDNN